jgi:hypothetical protein
MTLTSALPASGEIPMACARAGPAAPQPAAPAAAEADAVLAAVGALGKHPRLPAHHRQRLQGVLMGSAELAELAGGGTAEVCHRDNTTSRDLWHHHTASIQFY